MPLFLMAELSGKGYTGEKPEHTHEERLASEENLRFAVFGSARPRACRAQQVAAMKSHQ
jgi:hypothetical protein